MSGNLPGWAGADVVYSRVYRINAILCQRAYAAAKPKKVGRRGTWPWSIPEDVESAIDALNRGNEERLKAYIARYLSLALD